MSGGLRLFCSLSALFLVAAALYAGNDSKSSKSQDAAPTAPPDTPTKPVIDILHGTKVLDNYRWLEDANSPDTQKWVAEEMAYTRAVLDPLPGREAIGKRLTELLSIGSVGVPQIGGKYYFYTRREGMQNQPVLYVREGVVAAPDQTVKDPHGKDQPVMDQ